MTPVVTRVMACSRPGAGLPRWVLSLLLRWALRVAVSLAPAAVAATDGAACAPQIAGPSRQQVQASGWTVVYAPRPWPLVVGQHFALDIMVCPDQAGGTLPLALTVDADMPAHRHGMNYKPGVSALGGGHFRAEGLMLHMAGRWRLLFRLDGGGPISQTIDIR